MKNQFKFWTVANCFTYWRFLSIPLAFWSIMALENWWIGGALALTGSIADYFDGYYARKQKNGSEMGGILDVVADKLFLLLYGLFSPVALVGAVILELSGLIFSSRVRSFMKSEQNDSHFIAFGSKGITFFQMIIIIAWFIDQIGTSEGEWTGLPYVDFLEGVAITLSLCRLLIYSSVYHACMKKRRETSAN